MNHYVTGAAVKALREKKGLTQAQLAEILAVSDKAVSKWETGRGLPDISLLGPLAQSLGVSIPELLSGETITNRNRTANILRSKFYACPVCGNTIHATGEAMAACCGITLPPLDPEEPDEAHACSVDYVEDEIFVTISHPMEREHHISFIAYVTMNRVDMVKLYPEGNAEARFFLRGSGQLFWYCNRHGLFSRTIQRKGRKNG